MKNQPMQSFMQAVLGTDAAGALAKATEKSEALGSVVAPRTILGWLAFASRWDYDGQVPGIDGSRLEFRKSQATDLFEGTVTIGEDRYDFEHADVQHLAAALSVALGVAGPVSKALRDQDLVSLGQSIDLLVKMQVVNGLQKSEPLCKCGAKKVSRNVAKGEDKMVCPKCEPGAVEKTDKPGQAAAPKKPLAPEGAEAPTPTQPKQNLPPKPTSIKVTKSQAESKCSVCEAPQFTKKGEFLGCYCLRDLAKHATATSAEGGYTVIFGSEWSKANISLFLDIVGPGEA